MRLPAEQVSTRQLCAGLFAALTLPMVTVCAGCHWLWVLCGGAAAAILYYMVYFLSREMDETLPELARQVLGRIGAKAVLVLTTAMFLFLAACIGARSSRAFPQTTGFPAAGLAVLALSTWAASKGIRVVLRCAALLFAGLAVIFGVVLGFSVCEVQIRYLLPAGNAGETAAVLAVFTLPLLGLYFRREIGEHNTRPAWWVLAVVLTAALTAAVTAGCLSQPIAARENSFYMLAQSVSVFGVIERFEALVSAAYLTGSFCVTAILFSTAEKTMVFVFPYLQKKQRAFLFFLLTGVAGMFLDGVGTVWILGIQGLFCGFLPLLLLSVGALKKI